MLYTSGVSGKNCFTIFSCKCCYTDFSGKICFTDVRSTGGAMCSSSAAQH
jgi:hypothetical protein